MQHNPAHCTWQAGLRCRNVPAPGPHLRRRGRLTVSIMGLRQAAPGAVAGPAMPGGVADVKQQRPSGIRRLGGPQIPGLGVLLIALGSIGVAWAAPQATPPPPTTPDFVTAEPLEALSGGTATALKPIDVQAFSWPSTSMGFHRRRDFFIGNGLFSRDWAAAPGTDGAGGGLGPLYNASGCRRCHFRDGRGALVADAGGGASLVLHLSIPPQNDAERRRLGAHRASLIAEPTYGVQLQERALSGQLAEGRLVVDYRDIPVGLGDGSVVSLRSPRYRVEALAYGPMHPMTMTSPRVAPAMIGLGLLEAIDTQSIVARADAADSDADGISGRPNFVWSDQQQRVMLGRFGWKAGTATIADQVAVALARDVGISNPLHGDHWGDCTLRQPECRAPSSIENRSGLDISVENFGKIVFYSRQLAVPRRRNVNDSNILRGKALFYESGCTACHTARQVTRADWPLPALAGQLIWPYTDLLLHDMGQELADGRPEGEASGREWRTPPLWGIGLTGIISGHTYFLHDGRARNLLEAILWHGGEARDSREAVREMDAGERQSLLDFLNSL